MRKVILIVSLLLVSAGAHAASGFPVHAKETIERIKPAEKPVAAVQQTQTSAAETTLDRKAERQTTNTPAAKKSGRTYGTDEAKARRIAARYGFKWR
jgi:hypothetical protein